MKIIPCPSSPLLARRISETTGTEIADVTFKRFPDGELYVRVEGCREGVIVGSITTNDDLIAIAFLLDALDDARIVVPYMGYARQDRVFKEGEAVSIRVVANILERKAREIVTVNIHSKQAASHFRKLKDLDAMPVIGKHFSDRDVLMISPDKGSVERVKVAASHANCDWDYLEKTRIDEATVEIAPKNLDVEGRDVVIVDDIISTGGTVIEAAKKLYELGAKSVSATCVHAVLAGNAALRLFNAGIRDIIATDTIECAFSKISVAGIIGEAL
ncbi:ribose-phosphate diphosphokinase [Archaeoglobus neptunius]|uniref:ribose-phosphate diphosphokinase n=1 Tax=Archaeoglobus neptunius TaxID=2798580 RepID=UPI0019256546|nr:ribose-phosphate diphosphokinase [Archaeoglobus neptunius]